MALPTYPRRVKGLVKNPIFVTNLICFQNFDSQGKVIKIFQVKDAEKSLIVRENLRTHNVCARVLMLAGLSLKKISLKKNNQGWSLCE